MLPSTLLIPLLFVLFSSPLWSAEEDRLLPTLEAAKVIVTSGLDGRALMVTVKNDSSLLLTSGKLVCDRFDNKKPRPRLASNGYPWCDAISSPRNLSDPNKNCEHEETENRDIKQSVLPGKTKVIYFEMQDWRVPVVRCEVRDWRGRAAKFWE